MLKAPAFWLCLATSLSVAQTNHAPGRFIYSRLADLPPQQGRANPGVAGAFAGMSNGVLLVAGGANFPDGYPWQNGKKVWQSTVYALRQTDKHSQWRIAGKLDRPLAYGASAVWHNQLICIGGNDASKRYADVFTLRWDVAAGRLIRHSLPALPLPLANQSAAVLGDVLYVFGGESAKGAEKRLYALSLKNPASGWQKRADLPGPARAFTALVALSDALYVLGGRQTIDGKTTVFSDAYQYQPRPNSWSALPNLPVPLAAHAAAADSKNALLIFGGGDGVRLREIERLTNQLSRLPDSPKKNGLTQKRNALQSDHPGFRRKIWQFRTDSRTWSVVDTLPFATPVTTPVVTVPGGFILPSGEVSPGVRSPACWRITVPEGT